MKDKLIQSLHTLQDVGLNSTQNFVGITFSSYWPQQLLQKLCCPIPAWIQVALPKSSCPSVTPNITRMPSFWGYPPPPHDYPHYWFILDPNSKQDKVKVTNLKNLPKFQIFEFWKKSLCATHLLKLLDKKCKYAMDMASIVEDSVHKWTGGQMEKVKPLYPLKLPGAWGIKCVIRNLVISMLTCGQPETENLVVPM